MKISKIYSLRGISNSKVANDSERKCDKSDIKENESKSDSVITNIFDRKKGALCKGAVYFWGFSLRDDACLPQCSNELIIYYIGKSENNFSERIMQEITQLIFGGFGPIVDHNYMVKQPFQARLTDLKNSVYFPHGSSGNLLYKPDGLHVLYDFLTDISIKNTLDWMRERLIVAWIEDNQKELNSTPLSVLESEFHHIVRTNCFGIGHMKNYQHKKDVKIPADTPLFNKIDWNASPILKDWFRQVNALIP